MTCRYRMLGIQFPHLKNQLAASIYIDRLKYIWLKNKNCTHFWITPTFQGWCHLKVLLESHVKKKWSWNKDLEVKKKEIGWKTDSIPVLMTTAKIAIMSVPHPCCDVPWNHHSRYLCAKGKSAWIFYIIATICQCFKRGCIEYILSITFIKQLIQMFQREVVSPNVEGLQKVWWTDIQTKW